LASEALEAISRSTPISRVAPCQRHAQARGPLHPFTADRPRVGRGGLVVEHVVGERPDAPAAADHDGDHRIAPAGVCRPGSGSSRCAALERGQVQAHHARRLFSACWLDPDSQLVPGDFAALDQLAEAGVLLAAGDDCPAGRARQRLQQRRVVSRSVGVVEVAGEGGFYPEVGRLALAVRGFDDDVAVQEALDGVILQVGAAVSGPVLQLACRHDSSVLEVDIVGDERDPGARVRFGVGSLQRAHVVRELRYRRLHVADVALESADVGG